MMASYEIGKDLQQVLNAITLLAEVATITAGFNENRPTSPENGSKEQTDAASKTLPNDKEKDDRIVGEDQVREHQTSPHLNLSKNDDPKGVSVEDMRKHARDDGTNKHKDSSLSERESPGKKPRQNAKSYDHDRIVELTERQTSDLHDEMITPEPLCELQKKISSHIDDSDVIENEEKSKQKPAFGGLIERADDFLSHTAYASVYDTFVKYDIEVRELRKKLDAALKQIFELELLLDKKDKTGESVDIKKEVLFEGEDEDEIESEPLMVTISTQTIGKTGKTKTMKLLVSSDEEGNVANLEPLIKTEPKKRRVKKTPKKRVYIEYEDEDDPDYIPVEYRPKKPDSPPVSDEEVLDIFEDFDLKKEISDAPNSTDNSSKVYSCFSCNMKFEKPKELKEHLLTHSGVDHDQLHACVICSKSYLTHKGLRRHERLYHGVKQLKEAVKPMFKPHTCNTCGRSYTTKKSLRKHHRSAHQGDCDPKPFPCDQCSRSFNQQDHLDSHKRWHNGGDHPYQCVTCEDTFAKIAELKKHMVTVHGERPYKCNQCDHSYTELKHLKRHKITHNTERSYICDICGKGFFRLSRLNAHQRSHSGVKPFVCEVCDRAFTDIKYLLHHRRTHTGEKPFCCDICGKMFAVSITLMQHRRTHTGEKPYKCDECDMCFTTSSNLNRHKRRHSGLKPFTCTICCKAFSRSCDVKRHQITHTGLKPFRCDVCHIFFGRRSHLTRHQKKHDSPAKKLASTMPLTNVQQPTHIPSQPLPPHPTHPPEETHAHHMSPVTHPHPMSSVSHVMHQMASMPPMANYESIIPPISMSMQQMMQDNTRSHLYYQYPDSKQQLPHHRPDAAPYIGPTLE